MPTWPIETIRELLEPTLRHMGYDVYEIAQGGPGGRTLRIAIEGSEGVSLDDCEKVSSVAGPLLEQADLIDGQYVLEVSSPGAERPLRDRQDFVRNLGRRVNVRYRVGPGEGIVEGMLTHVGDDGIIVAGKRVKAVPGPVVEVGWADLLAARQAVEI